jgi:hypothetical protein
MVEALSYKPEDREFDLDDIIEFVNLRNPSSHTMDLEFTQPLTEMSTRRYVLG